MYRQDPQLQSAIKAAAEARLEINDRLGQAGGMSRDSQSPLDKSLMNVELANLGISIEELRGSVSELIERIAPVCQPGASGGGASGGDAKDAKGQIEAMPSDLRAKLMGLRQNVDGISRMIANVKFRIEI